MNELTSPQEPLVAGSRRQALTEWVERQLVDGLALTPAQEWQLHNLNGDAGFRHYYRLHGPDGRELQGLKLLAVDAPPETEDSAQFVALAQYLRGYGVRTPIIYAADPAQGFLLVEDFGDRLLQSELTDETAAASYGAAFMALLALQQADDNPVLIPRYDRALLRRELELFGEWFVLQLLNYDLSAAERVLLDAFFDQLERSALEQPQVLVHRDYHSRNLLLCDTGALGVIDFQGAVWGPCTYDPVSLLRDCYLRWPQEEVRRWAMSYGNMAIDVGIIPPVSTQTYMRWFDWMGLQRHIKVLGIFARLHLRDHKSHYLADLPRVIEYVLAVAEDYPELESFAQWFRARLLPLAKQHSWFSASLVERESL